MIGMHGITTSGAVPDGAVPDGTGPGRTTRLPMTPARIAALAIGVPVCLAVTVAAGLSFAAQIGQGQFTVRDAVPVGAGPVTAHLGGGDVHVQQGGSGQAAVTGTARYSLVRPAFTTERTANGVAFGYDCTFPFGSCGLDATVSVPAGTAASVFTDGGNATVTGTTGNVTVSSGGGDLTASRAAGNLTLNTDGGNISGTALTAARVTAGTGGGDVQIQFASVPRTVTVHTSGGNVTIIVPRGSAAYHVSASTDGGAVSDGSMNINSSSPNTITATSGGGDITIRQAP